MSRTSVTSDSTASSVGWKELEHQLDDLVRRAATDSLEDFYTVLLDRIVLATGAVAACLWVRDPQDSRQRWKIELASGMSRDNLSASVLREEHGETLDGNLARAGEQAVFLKGVDGSLVGDWCSALIGVRVDAVCRAAIEVFFASSRSIGARHDSLSNVTAAFAEAAAHYHRREQVQHLQQQLEFDSAVDEFALRLQKISRPKSLWYAIANEIARLVPASRVTLLTSRRSWRVRSVSHVDSFDPRSPIVRAAERLAAAAANHGEPIWLHTTEGTAVGEAAHQWHRYLEESASRSAALIPLVEIQSTAADSPDVTTLGAILIERLNESAFSLHEQRQLQRACLHSAAALSRLNASSRDSWGTKIKRLSTALALVLVLACIGAGFIPVDFQVTARGELQPLARREIFAPSDGVVRDLHVQDELPVSAGMPLLELSNDALELETTRVAGDLQTAQQQLVTLQAARLETSVNSTSDQRGQLAAEEERLKQVIKGLQSQRDLLLKQQEDLTIRSPISGRVITTNVEQLLRSRPIRRGQRLLTVVDETQDWRLEMWIEEKDVGYVFAAQKSMPKLPLEFILATEPSRVHRGVIDEIESWTEVDRARSPATRATARIIDPSGLELRPGASIRGKIHCGQRPLGFVWFRDLIDLIRVTFWL